MRSTVWYHLMRFAIYTCGEEDSRVVDLQLVPAPPLDGLVKDLLGLALAAGPAVALAHPPPQGPRSLSGQRGWRHRGRQGRVRVLSDRKFIIMTS